jgi:hypothetical protein
MFELLPALLLTAAATPALADVTDRVTRTVAISRATPITVQIAVGELRITAWDRADVSVEIVRRAPDSQGLALIPVHVEHGADGLMIRTTQTGGGRDPNLRTDVVLRVPVDAVLHELAVFEGGIDLTGLQGSCSARVERGAIVATNVSGSIRLETSMGNIRVDGAILSPEGTIRLRTFNGDVALGLAATPANARILALSMGGTIASDIPLTRRERWGPRFGEATIGKGEPVISVDVVNGKVSIRVAGAGR